MHVRNLLGNLSRIHLVRFHGDSRLDSWNPSRWQTFVVNQVSEIQTVLPEHHVTNHENPMDCASRDMTPDQLAQHAVVG